MYIHIYIYTYIYAYTHSATGAQLPSDEPSLHLPSERERWGGGSARASQPVHEAQNLCTSRFTTLPSHWSYLPRRRLQNIHF